jgi:hypothetical protein
VIFVPYQLDDSGVPMALSNLQRSRAITILDADVTARSHELLCHGRTPFCGRVVERCALKLVLKIDVTVRSKKLRCDGCMPTKDREVERRSPIRGQKIDVTASCNELRCDGLMPRPAAKKSGVAPFSS